MFANMRGDDVADEIGRRGGRGIFLIGHGHKNSMAAYKFSGGYGIKMRSGSCRTNNFRCAEAK
jgi:hypothetical protein